MRAIYAYADLNAQRERCEMDASFKSYCSKAVWWKSYYYNFIIIFMLERWWLSLRWDNCLFQMISSFDSCWNSNNYSCWSKINNRKYMRSSNKFSKKIFFTFIRSNIQKIESKPEKIKVYISGWQITASYLDQKIKYWNFDKIIII